MQTSTDTLRELGFDNPHTNTHFYKDMSDELIIYVTKRENQDDEIGISFFDEDDKEVGHKALPHIQTIEQLKQLDNLLNTES